jgi:hypothetical protein
MAWSRALSVCALTKCYGDALAGSSVEHLLTPAVGGAVLVAWTSAFVVAASLRNERTDI